MTRRYTGPVPPSLRSTLLVSVALLGCSKASNKDEQVPAGQASAALEARAGARADGAPPSEPKGRPACEIKVTGHQQVAWSTYWTPPKKGEPHPTHARSTYWASEAELELAEQRHVDYPLELTCAGPPSHGLGGAFSALSRTSRPTDVPFGKKNYPLASKADAAKLEPGQFAVGVLLVGEELYDSAGGWLEVSRFDERGVAGAFDLEATLVSGRGERIRVTGKFDIPCGDVAQSKCQGS